MDVTEKYLVPMSYEIVAVKSRGIVHPTVQVPSEAIHIAIKRKHHR